MIFDYIGYCKIPGCINYHKIIDCIDNHKMIKFINYRKMDNHMIIENNHRLIIVIWSNLLIIIR
jgi:hypothetical protein